MRGLVLVSISNVRYFTVTLFNLVATWLLLLVNARYVVVAGDYCSLLVLTTRSRFLCQRILGDLSTHYCSRLIIFQEESFYCATCEIPVKKLITKINKVI